MLALFSIVELWCSDPATLRASPRSITLPILSASQGLLLGPRHAQPRTTPPSDSHHTPLAGLPGFTDQCTKIFASCVFLSFIHQHVNSKRAETDRIGLSTLHCLIAGSLIKSYLICVRGRVLN